MTDYNRATKAIIKSFEQFTAAFGELNKQLEEDQSEKLGKMMIAYTDLYREMMAKNDVIGHFLREKQKELNNINYDLHMEKMQKLQDRAQQLRGDVQVQDKD